VAVIRARTGCVANNYGYGGKLVSPPWLCDEAERQGVFPRNRMRINHKLFLWNIRFDSVSLIYG